MNIFPTHDSVKASENAFSLYDLCRSRTDNSLDKSQFILSHISSQQVYLKSYASEGKKAQASWGCTPTKTIQEQMGSVLDVGFSTPLLKPRTAKIPGDVQHVVHNAQAPGDSSSSNSNLKDGADIGSGAEQVAKWSRLKQSKNLPPSYGGSPAKHTVQSPRNRIPESDINIARKRGDHTRKRKRSPDSERQALLSERRQRRCIKKAIIEPKKDVHEESDENRGPGKKRGSSKKPKAKGKGARLAAGLALMHGFSATNIGTKRLTLNPSFGVFKKGKASAKTETSQKGKQKADVKLWSEEAFLNRNHVKEDGASQPEPDESIPDSASSPSVKESTRSMNDKARSNLKARKAGRASVQEDHSEVTASPCLSVKPARARSVTWDIESDSRLLPSSPAIPVTEPNNGSAIADTRAVHWNKQAGDQQLSQHMPEPNQYEKPSTPILSHAKNHRASSEVSLAPSQSASQVIRSSSSSIELGSAAEPALARSEYFPLLPQDLTPDCAAVNDGSDEGLPFAASLPLENYADNEHYGRETPENDNPLGSQGDFSASSVLSQYLLSYNDPNLSGDVISLVGDAACPFAFDHAEGSTQSHHRPEYSYLQRVDPFAYTCGNEDMQYTFRNDDLALADDDLFTEFSITTEETTFYVADDGAFYNEEPLVQSNCSMSQDSGDESNLADCLPMGPQGRGTTSNLASVYLRPAILPDDLPSESTHSRIIELAGTVEMESDFGEEGSEVHVGRQVIPSPFASGRALLHGTRDLWCASQTTLFADGSGFQTVSDMEKHVAKQLRDHWRPQKL